MTLTERDYRPVYHFTPPFECGCMPFDPNGAIYWRGRYHLCYIFQRYDDVLGRNIHCWGHSSSADLVGWTAHPTALDVAPGDPETGIFSGSAFLTRDGRPALIYHGCDSGNCIAISVDDGLDTWRKLDENPIVANAADGTPHHETFSSWDPHAWREGETYYAIFGGNPATLFKSENLTDWRYLRRIVPEEFDAPRIASDDDFSCPDFFPLGGKHVLLGISHARGARYYVGTWRDEVFAPDSHQWLNWPGGTYFAPESLADDAGRRLVWAWALDPRPSPLAHAAGYPGVLALPRVLTLGDDDTLRFAPPVELETLRRGHQRFAGIALADGVETVLDGIVGDAVELDLAIDLGTATAMTVTVRRSPRAEERTDIVFDRAGGTLTVDFSRSRETGDTAVRGWCINRPTGPDGARDVTAQTAPFVIAPGEPLRLRVFVDRSIIDVFANERQAVTQRIFPNRADSLGVSLTASAGAARLISLDAWTMGG